MYTVFLRIIAAPLHKFVLVAALEQQSRLLFEVTDLDNVPMPYTKICTLTFNVSPYKYEIRLKWTHLLIIRPISGKLYLHQLSSSSQRPSFARQGFNDRFIVKKQFAILFETDCNNRLMKIGINFMSKIFIVKKVPISY